MFIHASYKLQTISVTVQEVIQLFLKSETQKWEQYIGNVWRHIAQRNQKKNYKHLKDNAGTVLDWFWIISRSDCDT